MRRTSSKNKKAVVLILLVAVFTLFSYGFDQLVIRQEDKIRNINIQYEQLKAELTSETSLSLQLENINSSILNILNENLKTRNFWLKGYLLTTRYDLGKLENEKFFTNIDHQKQLLKKNMMWNFIEVLIATFKIGDQLDEIYNWNYKYFPQYTDKENGKTVYVGIDKKYFDIEKIFNDNIDKFYHKKYDIYLSAIEDDEENWYYSFRLNHWYDIHQLTLLLIENLDINRKGIRDNIDFIDKLREEKEELILKKIENLKKNSSNKNEYILLSIISQILSLLFLLLLFKGLLLKKSNSK